MENLHFSHGKRRFRIFCLFTIIFIYLLILAGGYVRISGAGLGCPDWPKCFDRWYPPTDKSQLPSYIDPDKFNIALAWTEYANRVIGVITGFLILATFISALINYCEAKRKSIITVVAGTLSLLGLVFAYIIKIKFFIYLFLFIALGLLIYEGFLILKYSYRHVVFPVFIGLLLTGLQGWQGSKVVEYQLKSLIVTVHLVLALLIVCSLIYAYYNSMVLAGKIPKINDKLFPKNKKIILVIMILFIFQFFSGAIVRGEIEKIVLDGNLTDRSNWLTAIGTLFTIHRYFSMFVIIGNLYLFYILYKISIINPQPTSNQQPATSPHTWIPFLIYSLLGFTLLQLVTGLLMYFMGLPPFFQLLHLFFSSCLAGVLFLLMLIFMERR